jgi:hypothetical protein
MLTDLTFGNAADDQGHAKPWGSRTGRITVWNEAHRPS